MPDSLDLSSEVISDLQNEFRIMDIKLFDVDFWDLLLRFGFNMLVAYILIKLIYRSDKRNKNYAFTFFIFNPLIFFLCYLMNNVKLDLGFAFGLFAVFSILRYRTISLPLKEMTYLFIVIGIAVINALTTKKVSFVELLFTNVAILAITFFLEHLWYREHLSERVVDYEKIENIKPQNKQLLLRDLKDRTGLDIREFEIVTTDFLRDMARIRIFYKDNEEPKNSE
jgi:hypothetical protein